MGHARERQRRPDRLSLHGTDDHKKIELETPMYDALYAWCQRQAT